jgi:Toprim domain
MSHAERHADALAAYGRRVLIVKAKLRNDAKALAQELVPGGKVHGHTYSSLPPHRSSDNPSAFAIYIGGNKAGGWIDFVTEETGDALNLIMLVKGVSFKDAVAWAEDRYGLRGLNDEQREALSREVVKRQAVVDEAAEEKRLKNIRNACRMFGEAIGIEGTVADRYLQSRGIDLALLPYREIRWLRFLPKATYWMDKARPQMPAMIAGMVDGAGGMKACHLTFLKADGTAKADVDKPKLMWPEVKGLVIRLNRGKLNCTAEWAAENGRTSPLVLCEGIEDGLSLAVADPDLRVWAASSLSNLGNVPDHACASSFVVAQDNDWAKPQAQNAFTKAMKRLHSFNKPAVAVRSTVGKDFNDQLKGKL